MQGNVSADRRPAHPCSLEDTSSYQPLLPDHNNAAADPPAHPDLNLPEAVLEDMLATICADIPAQEPPPRELHVAQLQQGDCAAAVQAAPAPNAEQASLPSENPQQDTSTFSGMQKGDLQQKECRVIRPTASDVVELPGCAGSAVPDSNLAGGPQVAQLTNPCWDAPACAAPSPDADADADADANADGDMDADMDDDIDTDVNNGADPSGSTLHPLEGKGDLRSLPPAVMAEMFLRELLGGDPPLGTQQATSETTSQHAAKLLQSNAGVEDRDESAQVALAVSTVKGAHVNAVNTVQGQTASAACVEGYAPSAEGNKPSGVPLIAPQPLPERPAQRTVAFRLTAARRPLKDTCAQDFEEMVARGRNESSENIARAFAKPRHAPSEQSPPLQDVGVRGSEAVAPGDVSVSERSDTSATPVHRPACVCCAAQCTAHVSTNEAGVYTVACRGETSSGQQSLESAAKPIEAASIQGPALQGADVQGFDAETPGDEPEPGERAVSPASAAMQAPVEFGTRYSSNSNQQHDGAKSTELSLAGWMHTTQALVSCAATEDPNVVHEPVDSQEQEPMHLNESSEPARAETLYGFTLVNVDRLHVGISDEEEPHPGSTHASRHAALNCQRSRAVSPDLRFEELLSKDVLSTSGQLSGGEQPGEQLSQSQEQRKAVVATDQLTAGRLPHLSKESGIDAAASKGHQAEEEGSSAAVLAVLKSTSNAAAEFVAHYRAGIPAHTSVGKYVPDQAIMQGGDGFFMPGRCAPDQARDTAEGSPGAELMADCNTWQVPRVLQGSTGAQYNSDNDKIIAGRGLEAKGVSAPGSSQQLAEESSQPNHARFSQLPAVHAGGEQTSGIALLQQYISHSATSATRSNSLSERGDGISAFAALQEYASDNDSADSAKDHSRTSSAGAEMQSKPKDTSHMSRHSPCMSGSGEILAPHPKPVAEEPSRSSVASQSQSPESSLHIELALSDAESDGMGRVEEGDSHQSMPGSSGCSLHLDLSASESATKGGSIQPLAELMSHEKGWKAARVDSDDGSSFDQDDKVMEHCQGCSGQDSPTVLLRDLACTVARLKESQMELDAQGFQRDPARERQKQLVHERVACFVEHLKAATMAAEGVQGWE